MRRIGCAVPVVPVVPLVPVAPVVRVVAAVAVLALSGCSLLGAEPSAAPPPPPVTTAPPPSPTPSPVSVPPSTGWAGTVQTVRSGVVDLLVTTCEGQDTGGSGSLVAPDLVLTAAHVVDDAAYVTLRTQSDVTPGVVVAYDPATELALVRPDDPLEGHVFTLAPDDPAVGSDVAALGFPLNGSFSITDGIVSAVGEERQLNGNRVPDQILTSAAINRGNSGGPLIVPDGTQVGVVSSFDNEDDDTRAEGRGNAIAARVAREAVTDLGPVEEADTYSPCAPEDVPYDAYEAPPVVVEIATDDPRGSLFGQLLGQHGQGINAGDYGESFELFSPAMQRRMAGLEAWSSGLDTSYWDVLTIHSVEGTEPEATVVATLQTHQEPEDGHEGQTCSIFRLTYSFIADPDAESEYGWLIDEADAPEPTAC